VPGDQQAEAVVVAGADEPTGAAAQTYSIVVIALSWLTTLDLLEEIHDAQNAQNRR
jgi:hypothetical protein